MFDRQFSNLNISSDGGPLASLAWRLTEISSGICQSAKFCSFLDPGDFLLSQCLSCRAAVFLWPQLQPTVRKSTSSPLACMLQLAHITIQRWSTQRHACAATYTNTNIEQHERLDHVPPLLQIRVKACWWNTCICRHIYIYVYIHTGSFLYLVLDILST